ncbi:MAG: EAL domain-containing protein [Gammaproteobacteria bacterium]|nr:EAL domain-containing protein [Gammaproteobacteria bacterium]
MNKILFIEKSATLRHAMHKLLLRHNYDVELVEDFESGLAQLSDGARQTRYDGVILGWPNETHTSTDELLTALSEPAHADLPLLILAHDADSAKLGWVSGRKRTGFLMWDNHEDVIRTLPKLLSQQTAEAHCDRDRNAQIRVLLVDDSPTARVKFRKLLDTCGYVTATASCSGEAFEKALQEKFDIAIIDYFMPDENGDALCRRLRSNPQTSSIMLAVLTSTYLDRVIQSSLAAGAVECMFKNEADDLFRARVASMSRIVHITKRIERERTRLDGILSSVGDGVFGVDKNCNITFTNPATRQLLGYSHAEQIIGQHAESLFHKYETLHTHTNHNNDLHYLEKAIKDGREMHGIESIFNRADGAPMQVELTIFPLLIDRHQEGAVIAFRDVSVRKLLEQELKWQAHHDPLTKLLNRKYLEDAIVHEVQRLKRYEDQSALLYIDLDRFKYINDTIGHNAGDQLLIEVGQQLQGRMRQSDVLARLGGDEFGILLRNITEAGVNNVAEKFRSVLANYDFVREGRSYKINTSIGITMIDSQTSSPGEVLSNADIACHIAKGKGRNACHLYTQEQDNKTAMDMELGWSARLHQALEKNNFQLYYQPIVSLHEIDLDNLPREGNLCEHICQTNPDCCHTYEVLLRLNNPHGDPISPNAFLPTAERFNMMRDIDKWVINATMQQMAELGPEYNHITFTINLSGQSLDPDVVVPLVQQGIEKYRISPSRFLFEITETCAINDIYAASSLIERLSELGCRFALDDFGTGYCSFSHLKRLPVDYIKIDGMFVKDILTDPMDMAIIRSITNIAHSLGKETIAEFVESPDVLKLLKECGVDYIQGFYVARPSPKLVNKIVDIRKIVG